MVMQEPPVKYEKCSRCENTFPAEQLVEVVLWEENLLLCEKCHLDVIDEYFQKFEHFYEMLKEAVKKKDKRLANKASEDLEALLDDIMELVDKWLGGGL